MKQYWNQYFIGRCYPIHNPKYICSQCKFFTNKCIISEIEAKYGKANTPCCSEFKIKEKHETNTDGIYTN